MNLMVEQFANAVWGVPMAMAILIPGIFFTIKFFFPQVFLFYHALRVIIGKYVRPIERIDNHEISNFQAFCIAISAPIGLGSVAGVAIAISVGGAGAVFWMWMAGLVGMATKFSTITHGITHKSKTGETGPMFIIQNGLGKKFRWLAIIFSILTVISALCAGSMFQSNQMATMLSISLDLPLYASGIIFAIMTGLVLIGGKVQIGKIAVFLAPIIIVIYAYASLWIILSNYDLFPKIMCWIFHDAFSGSAAFGGTIGFSFHQAIVHGTRRALFSNEAGLGTASMSSVMTKINEKYPVQSGIAGMLGPFIDTIVVCSMTAFVILSTGTWTPNGKMQGVELTASAFKAAFGPLGEHIITLMVVLFAFSTILAWSRYGEKGILFMLGEKYIFPYKCVFIIAVFAGTMLNLKLILNLSDPIIALMAIPNLIAGIMLSGKLKKMLKQYKLDLKAERI